MAPSSWIAPPPAASAEDDDEFDDALDLDDEDGEEDGEEEAAAEEEVDAASPRLLDASAVEGGSAARALRRGDHPSEGSSSLIDMRRVSRSGW